MKSAVRTLFTMAFFSLPFFVAAQTPQLPQDVVASDGIYPDYVKINWTALAGVKYKVFRSETPDGKQAIELTKEWESANYVIDRNALIADKRYYYRVKAKMGKNESALSKADVGYIAGIASGRGEGSLSQMSDDQLNISLQAIERDTLTARDSFFVAYVVSSQANIKLTNIELRFFLSKDNQPSATDAVLGSVRLDQITPLSTRRGATRLKADSRTPKGQYCVVMMSYRPEGSDKTATSYKRVLIQ